MRPRDSYGEWVDVSLLAAFGAGMISFLSPCVLPLVPAYLSIVTGVSVAELQERETAREQRLKVMRGVGLFMVGFTVVFVLLGASAATVGKFLVRHQRPFEIVFGVVIIVFGVFLAGVVRPMWLERERRFRVGDSLGGWGAPVMGMAFAFGWTPCIGPILGGVLTVAAASASVGRGIALLVAYAIGLGVPFLLAGLALSEMSRVFGWFKRHSRIINAVAGAIMIVFGLLMVFGKVTWLSQQIIGVMDWLGLEGLTAI